MHNLKIKKFNENILSSATKITDGTGFFKTYKLKSGHYLKVAKTYEECKQASNSLYLCTMYFDFIHELYGKLLYSRNIKSSSIIKPNSILLGADLPEAYTIPDADTKYIDLDFFLFGCFDLDLIASVILKLSETVQNINKENIVMPDLGNGTNILIDPKTLDSKFIDYDGMQIDSFQTFSISKLLRKSPLPVITNHSVRDYRTSLLNSNVDKFTLFLLFLYYTTKKTMPEINKIERFKKDGNWFPTEDALHRYFNSIGIGGTFFEEEMFRAFYEGKFNYPTTAIKRLLKTYDLTQKADSGIFIKR